MIIPNTTLSTFFCSTTTADYPLLSKEKVQLLAKEYWITTIEDLIVILNRSDINYELEQFLGISIKDIRELRDFIFSNYEKDKVTLLTSSGSFESGLSSGDGCEKDGALSSEFKLEYNKYYDNSDLPIKSEKLLSLMSDIRNQGNRGTCVAFSSTLVHEFIEKNIKNRDIDLSEQYLYYLCKTNDGNPNTSGTYISTAVKMLNQSGQCTTNILPYEEFIPNNEAQPPASDILRKANKEAKNYQIENALSVGLNEITKIKQILVGNKNIKGRPMIFGIPLYSYFKGGEAVNSGKITLPLPIEKSTGGHAMALIGYRDDSSTPGGGYFIVQNSWGKSWGINNIDGAGRCHIPYAYFTKHNEGREAFAIFTSTELEQNVVKKEVKKKIIPKPSKPVPKPKPSPKPTPVKKEKFEMKLKHWIGAIFATIIISLVADGTILSAKKIVNKVKEKWIIKKAKDLFEDKNSIVKKIESILLEKQLPKVSNVKNVYDKVYFENIKIYGQGQGTNYDLELVKSKLESRQYILQFTEDENLNNKILNILILAGVKLVEMNNQDPLIIKTVGIKPSELLNKKLFLPYKLLCLLMKTQIENGKYLTPVYGKSIAYWNLAKYKDGYILRIKNVILLKNGD